MMTRENDNAAAAQRAGTAKFTVHIGFTGSQLQKVRRSAEKASMTVAGFIRQTALNRPVISPMDEEQRHFFRQLVGMSNDLHGLAALAEREGCTAALLLFEQYASTIDQLFETMKKW